MSSDSYRLPTPSGAASSWYHCGAETYEKPSPEAAADLHGMAGSTGGGPPLLTNLPTSPQK